MPTIKRFSRVFTLVVLLSWGGGLHAADSETDLVARWPMNDAGSRKMSDVGPHKLIGITEEVESHEGRGGKVFRFDGAKSKVELPQNSLLEFKGSFGISFWIRVDAGTDGPILANPNFSIRVFRGIIRVTFRNTSYPTTGYADLMGPQVDNGEWHHVVFSYNADTGESFLYLDGQQEARQKFAYPPEAADPTTVGFYSRFYLKGELSDLQIYARPLDLDGAVRLMEMKLP